MAEVVVAPPPSNNTVMMPPAQIPDGPKSPTDFAGWVKFLFGVPSDKLMLVSLIVLAGYFVYTEREDRKERDATQYRVQQEEGEKNRASAEAQAKVYHTDTVTLVKEIAKLETQIGRLDSSLTEWRKKIDLREGGDGNRAVPDANLPIDRRGPGLVVPDDGRHAADENNGRLVVGR